LFYVRSGVKRALLKLEVVALIALTVIGYVAWLLG